MITWIDVPGCDGTVANGVSPEGVIVGVAREPSGRVRGFVAQERGQGALRRGLETRLFDAPGAGDTFLQDVASGGLMIGDVFDGRRSRAFLLLGREVQVLAPPGAADAWAGGVLTNGDCCGALRDASGRRVGFRRVAGRFDEVLPAGAETAVLHGIGEGGEVVGACSLGGQITGFLQRPDGRVEWMDAPRGEFVPSHCAVGGSWVVGSFTDRDGLSMAGELREGRWRTVEVPGGPWVESALVGCCPGVGVVGWALGGDGRKRAFFLAEGEA